MRDDEARDPARVTRDPNLRRSTLAAILLTATFPSTVHAENAPTDLAARIAADSRQLAGVSVVASPTARRMRRGAPASRRPMVPPVQTTKVQAATVQTTPSVSSAASPTAGGHAMQVGPLTITPGGFLDVEGMRR